MKWHAKALAFKTLSVLPGGEKLYQFARQHITKSLVPNAGRVSQKLDVGFHYLDWLSKHGMAAQLTEGSHLDFGAGWHPTIPLLYYSLGVKRQYLFDIAPHLSDKGLDQLVNAFLDVADADQWPHRNTLQRLPPRLGKTDWKTYLERLGITYHAPYDSVFPSLASSLDVVTSTQVLMHIPRSVMAGCFRQIHASLKPGGVFLAPIHLQDILTGHSHGSPDKYNQLKYSPEAWQRWFSSSIMSFNRLKAPDYLELLTEAGFEILHFEVEPATAEDYQKFDRVKLADCFKRYTREELAARHLFFVARKP